MAQRKEWNAQINFLEAKVENAGANLKVKCAEMLHGLRAKQRAASEKIKELEKASGETWEQAKLTADTIWEDLMASVAEAHSRFK